MLKFWRAKRGLSQLDLACEAAVTPRHVSFLESGRAKPSAAMVVRLLSVLRVPLREQNAALKAAGFPPHYAEDALDALDPGVQRALEQMLREHHPYPMTVLTPDTRIVRASPASLRVFGAFFADRSALPESPDMVSLVFDPRLLRPFLVDWESVARSMLLRLHREFLERGDARVGEAIERALAFPDVPRQWRLPDFAQPSAPVLSVRLRRGGLSVEFLVTVTVFSAPQHVTLEELRIESCYPLDEATRVTCARLADAASVGSRAPRRRRAT